MTKYFKKWRKGAKKGKGGMYYMPNARGKKGAVKKAVRKVQAKTELKDRVAQPAQIDLTTVTGSITNGPTNSAVLVPEAFMTSITQGNLNGQFEGNEYTPKYLNLKMKLNFEYLNPYGLDGHTVQSYFINVIQGWVKISLKDDGVLSEQHNNASSGRHQPAFAAHADPHALALSVVKRALFQANFQPNFLSYERHDYGDVKVLRRFRVYGDQTKKFVTPMAPPVANPAVTLQPATNSIAPDKHYSFNWKMTNKKQELAPITGATTTFGNAETWLPFVMTTMHTDIALHNSSYLTIENVNHFTYSDI